MITLLVRINHIIAPYKNRNILLAYKTYLLGEPLGKYHKIEMPQFHVTPDDGLISRNIYIERFYCINFVILT